MAGPRHAVGTLLIAVMLASTPQFLHCYTTEETTFTTWKTTTWETTTYEPTTTVRVVSYNGSCSAGDRCRDRFTECYQGQCSCIEDYFWYPGNCRTLTSIQPRLLNASSITSESATITWSMPSDIYRSVLDSLLVTWYENGQEVSSSPPIDTSQSNYTLRNLDGGVYYTVIVAAVVDQNGRSQQQNSSSYRFRTANIGYGGNCSRRPNCVSSLVCDAGLCKCQRNFFRCGSSCCKVANLRPQSVTITQVTADSFRVSWSVSASYSGYVTVKWRVLGDSSATSATLSSGTRYEYVRGLRSATQYVIEVTSVVQDLRTQTSPVGSTQQRTKALYNETCSSTNDCSEGIPVSCHGHCVCTSGYFRHASSCFLVNSFLVPVISPPEFLTPSTAQINWNVTEDYSYAVDSYRVQTTTNNGGNRSYTAVYETSLTLTDLQPGMWHGVYVRSFINRDFVQQQSTQVGFTFYTNPAKPGPVNMTASFISKTFAFIEFDPVKVGGASLYHILLTGPSGVVENLTTPSQNRKVSFFDLVPGTEYELSITTEYANLRGEPYVGSVVTPAEEVSVPLYGAVLLFLVPALVLIVFIVLFILVLRGYALTNCKKKNQQEGTYSSTRRPVERDSTYCSLQLNSTPDPDTRAPPADPQNIYINECVARASSNSGSSSQPEEGQHIYMNSEETSAVAAKKGKKKALKPKPKAKPKHVPKTKTENLPKFIEPENFPESTKP